jgi:hypothetical protein
VQIDELKFPMAAAHIWVGVVVVKE